MTVYAKFDMYMNPGQKTQIQVFTKGQPYRYWSESSHWQYHQVTPNNGTGQPMVFNEVEFYNRFSFEQLQEQGNE